jgi:hypothetical protein
MRAVEVDSDALSNRLRCVAGPLGQPAASAARVTTKKPGYLLLVDIDANGNMSQIFPGPEMIVQSQEAAANFIKPGEELLIPNSATATSAARLPVRNRHQPLYKQVPHSSQSSVNENASWTNLDAAAVAGGLRRDSEFNMTSAIDGFAAEAIANNLA